MFSVEDLESHTKYSGGYEAGHPTIIGGHISLPTDFSSPQPQSNELTRGLPELVQHVRS
jgi:hypothetical protein